MQEGNVNISFDKSENDFILSWKDENGGLHLITIENGNHDIMVSFSSKKLSEGWREFIKLEEKNDNT